jgi:hypothetical protein
MKEKKPEEIVAARARALQQAWIDRNRKCTDVRQILSQLEGWLAEHSKALAQQFLRCSRFRGGIGRVVQNGTVACLENNPIELARQLLAGKSLEDIILREHEGPRFKGFYASLRFNEYAAVDVVTSKDDDLPVFKRWNFERAALEILKAAITIQKQEVLAATQISMQKFNRDTADIRGATARDLLKVLAELKCAVESDQRLVEGLEPEEIECLRPKPFPLQILSSDAIAWLLDAVSQQMIQPTELAGLQLETVKKAEAASEETAPERQVDPFWQTQI